MSSTNNESPNRSAASNAAVSTFDRRYSLDAQRPSRVGILRCSRCARCVEILLKSCAGDNSRRASMDSAIATANGMIRYGHNLYYCDRCARIVGYRTEVKPGSLCEDSNIQR